MKKILTLFLLIFTVSIIYTGNKIKAYYFESVRHDILNVWEIYNYYSTYYGYRFDYEIPEDVIALHFDIPVNPDFSPLYGGIDSQLHLLDSLGAVIVTIPIEYYGEITSGFDIDIDLEDDYYFYDGSHYDLTTCDSMLMDLVLTISTIPTWYYYELTSITNSYKYDHTLIVNYYSYNSLYLSIENTDGIITAPVPPTPITGQKFVGWTDRTGLLFDFGGVIESGDLEDGTIYLFARFISTTEIAGLDGTISGNIPDFYYRTMSSINFDTQLGYFFVYFIVLMGIVGSMLYMKINDFPIVLVSGLWSALNIYMGTLPIYMIILLLLILILVLKSVFSERIGGSHEA